MSILSRYRVYCENECCFVFTDFFFSSPPVSCPNDPSHFIDPSQTVSLRVSMPTCPRRSDSGGSGFSLGHVWFDESTGKIFLCIDDTPGSPVWRLSGSYPGRAAGKHHICVNGITKGGNWEGLRYFIFGGVMEWGAQVSVRVLARNSGQVGSLRIVDLFNGNVVALLDDVGNSDYQVLGFGELFCFPMFESVFELQGRKVDVCELLFEF